MKNGKMKKIFTKIKIIIFVLIGVLTTSIINAQTLSTTSTFLNNNGSITCGEGAEENSPLSTDPETEEETPSEEGGFLSSYAKNIAKSIMGTNSKGEDNTIDIGKDISKLIGLTENINRIKELLK